MDFQGSTRHNKATRNQFKSGERIDRKSIQNPRRNRPKSDPKWSQNRFKIDPESTQNRLKMALKTQAHKQLEKRGGNLDFGSPPETPGAPKIHEKTYQKNDQKTVPSKNDIFLQFVRFSDLPTSIFIDFGIQNGCPDHHSLIIF